MAKNWKRAHDKVQAELMEVNILAGQLGESLNQMRGRRDNAMVRLDLACRHLLAASEQFAARGAHETSELLRREAYRLCPRGDASVAGTKSPEEKPLLFK